MKKVTGLMAGLAAVLMLASCATTAKTTTAKTTTAKTTTTAATSAVPEHGVIYSGEVSKNNFVLADNHTYGKNFQFQNGMGRILPKDYKPQVGDVIKLHIEGTMNKAIAMGTGDDNDAANPFSIQATISDVSPAASYWKLLASKWFKYTTAVNAGDSFTFDMEFPVAVAATGKAGSGCADLIIGTNNQQTEAVIITTTKFTYEITRP